MKKIIIICGLVITLISLAIVGYADTELSAEYSLAEAVVIAEEPSSFCILIPSTIYVGEDVTLTAEFINIRANEQINVVMNNLDDNYCITLTNENGDMTNTTSTITRIFADGSIRSKDGWKKSKV